MSLDLPWLAVGAIGGIAYRIGSLLIANSNFDWFSEQQ